jgi:endogenous inhibitor of DNA gyrase (YacG/DUF329 family)
VTCPVCKKPTVATYRPFCSRRCADVDLGRWLTGSYRVPTDEAPDEGAAENSAPPLDSPRRTP